MPVRWGRFRELPRRQFVLLTASAVALPAMPHLASALDYPTRPVRMVGGFPAGFSPDIVGRLMGQWLSERLGQQFIVDNRPGASSNVGTEIVVRALPDGYTLLVATGANAINATLYENLSFNFIRDLTPVAIIAYAKANPGKINMASGGIGSAPHVAGELFKIMVGVDLVHVPYRANNVPDLLAGEVQVVFDPIPTVIGYIRSGRLRALAVTGTTHLDVLPNVPTVAEFVSGYEASTWFGLVAPKNTSAEIIAKLNSQSNAILADPEKRARLENLGGIPMPLTPDEFGKFIADETDKWAKVIKTANIKPE